MAMGSDEQQVLHPFFRQEFGLSVKSTHPNDLPPTTNTQPNEATPRSNENSACEQRQHNPTEYKIKASQHANESSNDIEEDPNETRRKRRKTDKTQPSETTATSNVGISAWLGGGLPEAMTKSADINDTDVDLPSQPLLAEAQLDTNAATISTSTQQDSPDNPIGRSSARQKTLKLNSKGKFLSSPASSPPRETKRGTGKRGRPAKIRSKLVVFKYRVGSEVKTGELVDNILSGKLVHRRVVPVAKPTLPSRKPATIKSSKPTHPFFSKKDAHKTDIQSATDSKQQPQDGLNTAAGTLDNKRRVVAGSIPSFSTSVRRASKFPELLDPLWPPQDFVHVRDFCPSDNTTDTLCRIENDRKKSKIAAMSIRDEESVLLTGIAEARRIAIKSEISQDSVVSLRHPIRHVASNQILRSAMEKQMSWSSPNPRFPWNASSPPLAKIETSLLSSVSAFDCGKYETQLWTQKYAPKAAEEVLQFGREPQMLRDWLRHLTITAVDTGKPPKDTSKSKIKRDKKRKKRQKADKLDGFIVSSEGEASEMDTMSGSDDELAGGVTQRTVVRSGDMAASEKIQVSNVILLSGPAGCGKTASVYAVAKELDFEVFEINPGSRRSARDMLERVGDMTQNHLVHLLNESETPTESLKDDGKQNKLMSFFKGPSKSKQPENQPEPSPIPEADPKRPRQQKQSLILLEEADLLFEEDKQFWTGVLTLIAQSRRPIIITCNDESLIPIQDMSLHAILRYQKAPQDLGVDYLLLIAASEGHILKREAVTRLYQGSGKDLRKSLMDLNFWCQMGVGSEKSGLDWLLPAWPPESNVDFNGDRVRVLSLNTYERFMGWFNRDILSSEDTLEQEAEINRNTLHWWGMGLQESEDVGGRSDVELIPPAQFQSSSKTAQLDMLCREADYFEMRSSLDILCSSCSIDMNNVSGIRTLVDTPTHLQQDDIDISAPPLPEGHRSNYLDTYPLLQSDLRVEHSSISESVSTTFNALLSQTFRPTTKTDLESSYASRIVGKLVRSGQPQITPPSTLPQFQRIFETIMRPSYAMLGPTRPAPSFENGLAAITEDLAPYIRGIMVFDGRLHQYRQQLYELTAQQHRGEKRSRTTRASRAALEGGDKSSTRKERWFANEAPYYQIQATAGPGWQHVLHQMGYFHVQPVIEPSTETSEPMSINQIIENVQ
ncbi:uncharacterized protein N7511_002235 [Penicillium nucicola]|uniref:uncharacterized protein n=1 Tax=Penicillium nucicola TaxID=1850975 RepID=UPI002545B59E|nr:uncharacterized protein N7511_002235 [Penicillium nucicola]KAJ5770184.1 hypothetical protein N7511_002235 [Penicillium nucicola]